MNRPAATLLVLLASATSASCGPAVDPGTEVTPSEPSKVASSAPGWPASLVVMGDGFPTPGDACRRVGESDVTVNWLDDSASLVGCPTPDAAAALDGTVVGTVDGVTLVSVPNRPQTAGDGDGQGDAMVSGTPYHATAQIRCEGYLGAAPGFCDAGVVRGLETGTYVDILLPDGRKRTIFFNADGSFLSFSTAEADGTAAMPSEARRAGDVTVATLGTERYEIPDVFVLGD